MAHPNSKVQNHNMETIGNSDVNIIEEDHEQKTPSFESVLSRLSDDEHMVIISHIQGLMVAHKKQLAEKETAMNGLASRNSVLECKIQQDARTSETLTNEIRAKTALVGKLQEKVIDQGRFVTDLCKEVDRLYKENESLSIKANLVSRLQEKIVDQGRMVSQLCKEVDKLSKEKESLRQEKTSMFPRPLPLSKIPKDDSLLFLKSAKNFGPSVHTIMPDIQHRQLNTCGAPGVSPVPPPILTRQFPVAANNDNRRQRRRVSMSGADFNATDQETIYSPICNRKAAPRRMSTGTAACA
mmetsp:Transcript_32545/g.47486  ORF Transcript_32545/g.47486 Transcript_32545/m.47486 type:complete len:297 (+) Transcript_32545:335-1225(+)